MLKIATERTFQRTVTALAPVDGGFAEEAFGVTYRVLSTDAADKFNTFTVEGTTKFLRAVIVKLDDLEGEGGRPVPYNDEVRDMVIGLPHARAALIDGYFKNVGKAKEGN